MPVVAKRLDGPEYHLVRRYASAGQATLDGDPSPTERGTVALPHFLLWRGRLPQLLPSTCQHFTYRLISKFADSVSLL